MILAGDRLGPRRRVVQDRQPPQMVGGQLAGHRVVQRPVEAVHAADRRVRLAGFPERISASEGGARGAQRLKLDADQLWTSCVVLKSQLTLAPNCSVLGGGRAGGPGVAAEPAVVEPAGAGGLDRDPAWAPRAWVRPWVADPGVSSPRTSPTTITSAPSATRRSTACAGARGASRSHAAHMAQRVKLPPLAIGAQPQRSLERKPRREGDRLRGVVKPCADHVPGLRCTTSWRAWASRSNGSPPKAIPVEWAPACTTRASGQNQVSDAVLARAQAELHVLAVHEDRLVERAQPTQGRGPGHKRGTDRPSHAPRRRGPPRCERCARRAGYQGRAAPMPGPGRRASWAQDGRCPGGEPSPLSTSGASSRSGRSSRSASAARPSIESSTSSTSGLSSAVTAAVTSLTPRLHARPKPTFSPSSIVRTHGHCRATVTLSSVEAQSTTVRLTPGRWRRMDSIRVSSSAAEL